MRARLVVLSLAVAAALAGCGTEVAPGQEGGRTPSGTDGTPSTTASTSAPATPPVRVTDAAAPRSGGPCQPSQLRLVAGGTDASLGYREMAVVATNTSRTPCTVAGYATATMWGTSGQRLRVTRDRTMAVYDNDGPIRPRTVRIAPGRKAVVRLGWRGGGAATGVEQVGSFALTVTRGSAPAPVTLTEHTMPIDIVDGGSVRVSGWRTAPETVGPQD
ncbi:DUF4232 domain-containing protein [Luteipulveratus sp. YIM 133132]|uniref:DUF4232 domain-containing protein n=1 Tax=Luteipulveratus flavus TaxID=3031728 RepID=UPI0023B17FB6|nr:DUF4232 domain-containing protein [Luteipulveratus sp. YIM 133132]MDE9367577.1 DUF4232 domain-containing protein [Luteipulveratus sp. YIM 133132]